jgi:Co/Zn/Cd efflux system component
MKSQSMKDASFRKLVLFVAALNLSYFFVEIGVAVTIKSVSLFADSIDFLEDTSINFLIALALGWSAVNRARMGMALSGILLIPGFAALWEAWQKFLVPIPPAATPLSITGAGAFVVNLFCAFLLARFRSHSGSLARSAFLSARNDAIANIAIIVAGVITAYTRSGWPDLVVGLGIILMNADASREVWKAACDEHRTAKA